jgi:DNA-binding SARP family transcriptional activator
LFVLNLFGGVSIQSETGSLSGRAVQRHRLALLALLASARERGVSRDRLVRLLWRHPALERARRQLSDSVYRINAALGGDVITAAGDELKLRTDRLRCDFTHFCQACERAEWQKAVELYTGPFLDGFSIPDSPEFESWADEERERIRRSYASAMETLAGQAEAAGNIVQAADYWRTLAAHDRFNSRIALHLIQTLDAAGERAAALQHARTHSILLREELGVEPPDDIIGLVAQLKRAGVARTPDPPRVAHASALIAMDASLEITTPSAAHPVRPGPARRFRWLSAALIVALAGGALVALAMHNRRYTSISPMV